MAAVAERIENAMQRLDDLTAPAARVAACAYGPAVFAAPGVARGEDLLVLCEGYAPGLRAHLKVYDGSEMRFLIVDRQLVEADVEKGTLGDYLTEQFLYPHKPILNTPYIDTLTLKAQVRVAKEEARDLALEYGEMCRGLVATPEFFGLSRMRKLARVFIPSMESYLRLLEKPVRTSNMAVLRHSFREAIAASQKDILEIDGDYVSINDAAVDRWLKDRVSEQVVNVFRQSQRAFSSYITKGRALYLSPDLLARELLNPLKLSLDPALDRIEPDDPKECLYLRAAEGLISVSEKASLEELAENLKLGGPVTITPLAGVLNEVSLVTAGKEQLVAKKFTDWHGFKWFTLNLVSLGSKLFAVSGKARMTNEYGMNRYLAKRGVKVPNIVYVSINQRILVEQYLGGASLGEIAKQAVNQPNPTAFQSASFEAVGTMLATIHRLGVSVGDAKPENFIASGDEVFIVDLEQASKRGDYSWDIAELLFYTGHYCIHPAALPALRQIVEVFVRGYLKKGRSEELRKAAAMKNAKVFSIWTPPPVIFEISRILRAAK